MTSEQATGGYHHGDLRNALLAAAGQVLGKRGAGGLSLRAVARQAGVSHAAPYRHFRDKAALLSALRQAGFEQLGQTIHAAVDAKPQSPEQKLIEAATAYVRLAMQHPEMTRIMFSGTAGTRDQLDGPDAAAATYEALLGIVREGVQQGSFRQRPPQELVLVAWASMHGLAMLALSRLLAVEQKDEQRLDELVRSVAGNVIFGIVK